MIRDPFSLSQPCEKETHITPLSFLPPDNCWLHCPEMSFPVGDHRAGFDEYAAHSEGSLKIGIRQSAFATEDKWQASKMALQGTS